MRLIAPVRLALSLTVAIASVTACAGTTRPTPAPSPRGGPRNTAPETAPGVTVAGIARARVPAANPRLPAVPEVHDALKIRVVYPTENSVVTSRDSNFIFGSVGDGSAGLRINGTLVPVWPNGAFMGWIANPPASAPWYDLIASTGSDSATATRHIRYPVVPVLPPPRDTVVAPSGLDTITTPSGRDSVVAISRTIYAVLRDDSLARAVADTDRVIIGRPTPTGTYRWFLFPGTPVRVTGYLGDMARVALDDAQSVWVARSVVKPVRHPVKPSLRAKAIRVVPAHDWIDVRVAVASPPAYVVDEGEHRLTVTLYGVTGNTMRVRGGDDPYVSSTTVTSRGTRTTIVIDLSRAIYGYLAMYRDGAMIFRVRRPPTIDASAPLRGLTIVVDPGHPPAGANGPTGLYEAVATLAVGQRVRDMLSSRGAHVIMTRTNDAPVALGDRPIIARRANADILVSIHLNALPDGMNPFRTNGTGTYYFHSHSERFASLMQKSLVAQLGLRDLGTFRENLALVRPTWMPAVLTEGVFIIMPDQEAAMRTPEYQAAYAQGVVNGVEQFVATWQ